MAARVRTHVSCSKIERREVRFAQCSVLEAIIRAAAGVEWLATKPGCIIVADSAGRFITRVWNADAFTKYCSRPDVEPTVIRHSSGDYVTEDAISSEVRPYVGLLLEIPV